MTLRPARWSRRVYEEDAVGSGYNLHKMPKDVTLKDHFAALIEPFYTDTLNKDMPLNPVAAQRKTPLQAVAPLEVAEACRRVAQGGGCPPDGRIVHAAFLSIAGRLWVLARRATRSKSLLCPAHIVIGMSLGRGCPRS